LDFCELVLLRIGQHNDAALSIMTSSEQSSDKLIDFQCPYCGSPLSFLEARLGTAQECPYCSEIVVVPSASSEKGGKLPLPIKTPRLIIRPLKTEDLPDWLEFVKDDDSYKYLDCNAPDDEQAISWLERGRVLRLPHSNKTLSLGIELQNEAKIIGDLSLVLNDPEEHRQGVFSILIHPAFRCQGYGTEALLGLIGFGFNGVALHDIRASIDFRDLAGRRMVEKAGMKLEGEFVEERRFKGEWISTAYYVILSKWWQRAKTS
jgi:[ribosomal protein S5]-alanine N-acetyltransferase